MGLSRPTARRLLAAIGVAVSLLFAGVASAQTIGIVNEASLPRTDAKGATVGKRPLNLTPEAVNLQDCVDDQQILFSLQLAGYEVNAQIQVWASGGGQECKAATSRQGGVQTCWQIGPNVSLQPNPQITIPVRQIMSGISPFKPTAPDATANACGKIDLATVNVHFIYLSPGNTTDATVAKTIPVTVDTVGPNPPSGLRALAGDTRIKVEWNSIAGAAQDDSGTSTAATSGSGLTELTGVKVYCDSASSTTPATATTTTDASCTEVPNDGGVDEAGSAIDAGFSTVCTGGGTSSETTEGATCASPNFTKDGEKVFPTADFNAKFECGSFFGNTGTSVTATGVAGQPLVNGTAYAVAVAATDKYGNVGPLSDVVCKTPNTTSDFWRDYRNAGGQGGGGCTTSGEDLPLGSSVALGTLALTVLTVKRRRQKARGGRGK